MARQILWASDAQRVRYALRLAGAPDVVSLTGRRLEALWRDHRAFIGLLPHPIGTLPGIGMQPVASFQARQIGELAGMQTAARELLRVASEGEIPTTTMEGTITVGPQGLSFGGLSPEATFRTTLTWLLTGAVGRRVSRCPECGTFFLRVRRQIYCRDACTDRATWRRYTPEQKHAWESRKRRHEQEGWAPPGSRAKKGKRV